MFAICVNEIDVYTNSSIEKYKDCIYYYNISLDSIIKHSIKTNETSIFTTLKAYSGCITIYENILYISCKDEIIAINLDNGSKITYKAEKLCRYGLYEIIIHNDLIYSYSCSALFQWNKSVGLLNIFPSDRSIVCINVNDDFIYLSTEDGFRIMDLKGNTRVLIPYDKYYTRNIIPCGINVYVSDYTGEIKKMSLDGKHESVIISPKDPYLRYRNFTIYNELIYIHENEDEEESPDTSFINIYTLEGKCIGRIKTNSTKIYGVLIRDDLLIFITDRSIKIYSEYYPHHRIVLGLKQKKLIRCWNISFRPCGIQKDLAFMIERELLN